MAGISKIVYGGETLIDLTGDDVTAGKMLSGTTAHNKSGDKITGTIKSQAGKTVTPSGSEQTAVASGVYTMGAVKVAAVPTETKSVTPSTSAQTVTPSTGKFLSSVNVSAIQTETKTVSPDIAIQEVTPSSGKYLTKVTVNAVKVATQATPSISVSSSGLITASATQTGGYVSSGTKSATKQLTTKSAQTYTPTTSNQTISSGRYLTGTQTIKGDSNLVASNIKKGVSIFGVSGTYEGSGGGSSGGTVTGNFGMSNMYGCIAKVYYMVGEYDSAEIALDDYGWAEITAIVGTTIMVEITSNPNDYSFAMSVTGDDRLRGYPVMGATGAKVRAFTVPNENFYCDGMIL